MTLTATHTIPPAYAADEPAAAPVSLEDASETGLLPDTADIPEDYPEDFSTPDPAHIAPVAHNAFGEDEGPEAPAPVEWGGEPQVSE